MGVTVEALGAVGSAAGLRCMEQCEQTPFPYKAHPGNGDCESFVHKYGLNASTGKHLRLDKFSGQTPHFTNVCSDIC